MKRNQALELKARQVAQAAVVSRLVAPMLREVISDRKVRAAAGHTYETGRKMFDDVRGSDPKHVVARMARDERLQSEIATLVRSATNAVDQGIASGRRRVRRRLLRFVMIGAGVASLVGVALRRRFANSPVDGDESDVRVTETMPATSRPEPITR